MCSVVRGVGVQCDVRGEGVQCVRGEGCGCTMW